MVGKASRPGLFQRDPALGIEQADRVTAWQEPDLLTWPEGAAIGKGRADRDPVALRKDIGHRTRRFHDTDLTRESVVSRDFHTLRAKSVKDCSALLSGRIRRQRQ